jgi:hypothetical protein
MSDWVFLNKHRVREPSVSVPQRYCTDDGFGFNGMFRFVIDGKQLRCIASDGEGWQHVSVSIELETKPPTWSIMVKVKELFWEDEDVVVQYHPAKSQYVNMHPGCLHLWKPTGAPLQAPHYLLVGLRSSKDVAELRAMQQKESQ